GVVAVVVVVVGSQRLSAGYVDRIRPAASPRTIAIERTAVVCADDRFAERASPVGSNKPGRRFRRYVYRPRFGPAQRQQQRRAGSGAGAGTGWASLGRHSGGTVAESPERARFRWRARRALRGSARSSL